MNMRLLAVAMAVLFLASCGGGGGKSSPPLRIAPAAPPTAADRTQPGERQTPPPGSEFEDPPDRNADHRFDPNEPDPGFFPSLGSGGDRPRPAPPPPPTGPEGDPAHHLTTPRFTVHQPRVLEQIGAHHAYARGLTGRGVRIGIQDSMVDYTQTGEFGSRVLLRRSDGAVLSYMRPFGDDSASDIGRCRSAGTCKIFTGDSQGDGEARNRWVREIVSQTGWDLQRLVDSVFTLPASFAFSRTAGCPCGSGQRRPPASPGPRSRAGRATGCAASPRNCQLCVGFGERDSFLRLRPAGGAARAPRRHGWPVRVPARSQGGSGRSSSSGGAASTGGGGSSHPPSMR